MDIYYTIYYKYYILVSLYKHQKCYINYTIDFFYFRFTKFQFFKKFISLGNFNKLNTTTIIKNLEQTMIQS